MITCFTKTSYSVYIIEMKPQHQIKLKELVDAVDNFW